jgi:ribonucleotide reductase beta subunit family protein with ferritin-like domain
MPDSRFFAECPCSILMSVCLSVCESRTWDFIYVLMNQNIPFCADRLLRELKQPTIYNVINPFPWMDTVSLQGKTNFFEKWVSQYARKKWGQ